MSETKKSRVFSAALRPRTRLTVLAYRTPLNVVADNLAANQWASTTGLDVQGALNRKAGKTDPKTFLDIQGICNVLAGTSGLAAPEALRRISS